MKPFLSLPKPSVLYLAGAALIALLLKSWYSQASISEMNWIMLPLVKLLDMMLPGSFELQASGEWFHAETQILLVKGCSGMNFLIMSFVSYALIFNRSDQKTMNTGNIAFHVKMHKMIGRLLCALFAAWLTTLLVNTMRILLALLLVNNSDLVSLTGLTNASAHRLAGLMVYIPALYYQFRIGSNFDTNTAFLFAAGLMVSLMIITPIITGNAFTNQAAFVRHSLWVMLVLGAAGVLVLGLDNKHSRRSRKSLGAISQGEISDYS